MPVRTWAPNHRVAAPKRLKLIQKDDFFGIPKCPSIVVLIIWIAICMPDFQSCRAYKSEDFLNAFVHQNFDVYSGKYGVFEESRRLELREETRRMFVHAYDSYMRFAFPMDELNPVSCEGRGPDYDNPLNININDVLGDYCLTLVDSLDSLAVLGNETEFRRAVQLVIDYVSFDKDNTVQVFEATIRELGGLLSAHLIITDPKQLLGNFSIPKYNDELLHLAHDLASRLLPAFEGTNTGIPYPRVKAHLLSLFRVLS